MNIKDYAHYYIGQPCFNTWFPADHEAYNAGWKLTGIQSTSVRPFGLENETDKTWTESIMLVLRRLEDMMEEEAITIARLCFFDRDKGYPDSDFKARKVGIGSEKPSTYEVRIDNDWYDEVIKIGFITGNIWRCNGSIEHLHNQSQVFHYRIKQGFDLFGLIPAGLAIDIKTLTP